MLEGNGSLSGVQTRDTDPAGSEIDTNDAILIGLVALTITSLILRPQALPFRLVRTALLATLLLCRYKIVAFLERTVSRSVYTYAAVVLSVQYAFAAVKAPSDSENTPSARGKLTTFPPLIFPSHTTHTRLIPSRHSFRYPYLLVGIPIGWRHDAGLISCDPVAASPSSAWFSVHAEDYLARGGHPGGLRAKLDDFLRQQRLDPAVFPHAYLVTAPRFLGWCFNPVSFWYLYDELRLLKAMILEVNNTFDERRVYLLQPPSSGNEEKFRMKWQKDFHVSPFNDRRGEYSLLAIDPFATERGHGNLQAGWTMDNTITLLSPGPDAKPKIVARVNSVSVPLNPLRLTHFERVTFMARWCWTGFLTNPRILREARVLWMRNKLPVFFRPEVNAGSIGRQETAEEVILEAGFREWLRSVATTNALHIGYIAAAGPARGQRVVLGGFNSRIPRDKSDDCEFDVEILTPEWYAALARSADVKALFDKRCFAPAVDEGMAVVIDPGQRTITSILRSTAAAQRQVCTSTDLVTIAVDRLRLGTSLVVMVLSVVAALMARRPSTDAREQLTFSDLVDSIPGVCKRDLERAAFMVLLADRLALGFTGLLRMYGRALWYLLVYTAAAGLSRVLFPA